MSAIYGFYCWGEKKDSSLIEKMEEPLHKYKVDRFSNERFGNVQFGCGLQCFTQESEREQLPIVDDVNQICITADVVLDNRAELMQQLEIDRPNLPDGELIHLAYVKWGEEFVKLLRGVFAIAIYDRKQEELFLYTDHTGSRCVNYHYRKDGFAFASTFAPIRKMFPDITYSEKWITACESARTPDMELFAELTPYEEVLQLEAGTYLKVSEHNFEKKVYWNPLVKNSKMAFEDKQCRELFLTTFRSCVKDVLRSKKNTAAMVSCGLDSTSVAALAAEYVGKEGKTLYSFTSVPEKECQGADSFAITDESWGPEELKKKYDNIEINLIDCQGMDGFSKLPMLVEGLELPTKSAPNMMWIHEIYEQAREKGCYILLKGQYGNATISYGKILGCIRQLMRHGHYIRAIREVNAFGQKNGIPKKKILKQYLLERKGEKKKEDYLQDSMVWEELLRKYEINETIYREIRKNGGGMIDSEEQMCAFQFDKVSLAQLGMYDTRLSLMSGVLVRDPTKDKRLIELCLNLPIECYVHDGVERRIAREYMSGIVPEQILQQNRRRGLQSADYVDRVLRNWEQIKVDVMEKIERQKESPYFDRGKIDMFLHKLSKLEEALPEEQGSLIANAFNLYAFTCFLES